MWTGHLSTPQKPEQLALEIDALDSNKEQLLKEGEAWRRDAQINSALPCPALPCPSVPSCYREVGGGKAGGCEASSVFPVWSQGLLNHH